MGPGRSAECWINYQPVARLSETREPLRRRPPRDAQSGATPAVRRSRPAQIVVCRREPAPPGVAELLRDPELFRALQPWLARLHCGRALCIMTRPCSDRQRQRSPDPRPVRAWRGSTFCAILAGTSAMQPRLDRQHGERMGLWWYACRHIPSRAIHPRITMSSSSRRSRSTAETSSTDVPILRARSPMLTLACSRALRSCAPRVTAGSSSLREIGIRAPAYTTPPPRVS